MDQRPSWYKRLNGYPFERQTFDHQHMLKIEKELRNGKKPKKKQTSWYLGTSLFAILSLVMVVFFIYSSKFNSASHIKDMISSATQPDVIKSNEPNATLGKQQILDRMLNSMDFFRNVDGVYHVDSSIPEEKYTVEFLIDEGERPRSYVVRKGDGVTSKSITTITDGSTRLEVYPGKSEVNYRKEAINNQSSLINPPKTRFYKDKNGDMNWITRGDVASAYDRVEMVFPQNYAFWTIDEQSLLPNYTILGKETIAGREAMVLTGPLNTYIAEKQHASFYKYWVDSKTGVMLKMNLLNKDNNPVFKMEMEKIVFDNETIDHSKFSTQPKQDWVELNNKKNERSP